jgi:hypothetical protein
MYEGMLCNTVNGLISSICETQAENWETTKSALMAASSLILIVVLSSGFQNFGIPKILREFFGNMVEKLHASASGKHQANGLCTQAYKFFMQSLDYRENFHTKSI